MAEATGLLDAPPASAASEEAKQRRAWQGRNRLPETPNQEPTPDNGPADGPPEPGTGEPEANGPAPTDPTDQARQLRQERRQDRLSTSTVSPPSDTQTESKPDESDKPANWRDNRNLFNRARQAGRSVGGSLQAGAEAARQAVAEVAEQVALQAQRKAWQIAHEILEEAALDLFYIPLIGIAPLFLYTIRLFIGQFVGKLFTINFRGIRLALVPSMGLAEFVARAAKNLLILVITLIWIFLLWLLIYGMQNIAKVTLQTLIEKLGNLLGGG